MSILSTVQTVAKNYDEVSTKINAMLVEYGIVDSNDIKELDVIPFGSGMFLCVMIFNQFLRWMKFPVGLGLRIDAITKVSAKRPILPLLGLAILSIAKRYKAKRAIAPKMGILSFVPLRGLKRIAKLGIKLSYRKMGVGKVRRPILALKISGKSAVLNGATITWP